MEAVLKEMADENKTYDYAQLKFVELLERSIFQNSRRGEQARRLTSARSAAGPESFQLLGESSGDRGLVRMLEDGWS
eukprot:754230-Hanusia_phi.AAC.6